MHPALARPVRRHLGSAPLSPAMQAVLDAASLALEDMQRDRALSARTMDELSMELEERFAKVRASEARYKRLFDGVPHPTFVLRRTDRCVLDWNAAAEHTFGWSSAEVAGRPVDDLHLCTLGCRFAGNLAGDEPIESIGVVETLLHARDGRTVECEVQGLDILLADVPAVLVMVRDVTAQRAAERAERDSTARFQAFFDYAGIAIQMLAADGTILQANPACRDMLGYTPDEMVGAPIERFLVAEDAALLASACTELITAARESVSIEQRFEHKDGTIVWGQLTVARVQTGVEARLMVMLQDVTERKRMEEELVRRAFQDDLTGLANRALFHDRLRHALQRRARNRTFVGVLLLDLDGFKRVNDSLGHAAGDQLLRAVAQRITVAVRAGETVARLGGDEFAIVIESVVGEEEVRQLADRLLRVISRPVTVAERDVVVNVSIGLALAVAGEDGDSVLRNADVAMYAAKNAGKQCARLFDPSMLARAQSWLELEQDLRRAVVNHEFELHFQPLMNLQSGALRGFEALLRWRHPRRGLVWPSEFLAVAEETGVIVPIGRWALREACCYAAGWAERAGAPPSISVNLAPRQLEHEHLLDDVKSALTHSGLDPRLLVLEITESQMMRAPETAHATLQALRALGVRIAIDDFGTGYSSLSQLQFFPVDELKIDRTFVARMDEGDREASFVRTMITLAHSLGVDVVAEGIERTTQQLALTQLGCNAGQGFLFSHPLPINDALIYLATHDDPVLAAEARATTRALAGGE
jgi:diguanylate cyclase (GGDEF)-like protein/PAS domain S-box-containing protein